MFLPFLPSLLPQLLEEAQRVHVSFCGEFGRNTTNPRDLGSGVRRRLGGRGPACYTSGSGAGL